MAADGHGAIDRASGGAAAFQVADGFAGQQLEGVGVGIVEGHAASVADGVAAADLERALEDPSGAGIAVGAAQEQRAGARLGQRFAETDSRADFEELGTVLMHDQFGDA